MGVGWERRVWESNQETDLGRGTSGWTEIPQTEPRV